MDLNTIGSFIAQNGFPVFISIALLFFCYKLWMKMSEKLDEITKTNESLVRTNSELIAKMDLKIDLLDDKIEKIYDKVEK